MLGIDISKDHLDVHLHPSGKTRRVTNDAAGHKVLLCWLNAVALELVVFEATGPCHRLFERTLVKAGLRFAKVNPRQARRFAEATGRLAKTDKVDAAMLRKLGALLKPETCLPKSQLLDELTELVAARRGLMRDRTACLNPAGTDARSHRLPQPRQDPADLALGAAGRAAAQAARKPGRRHRSPVS